MFLSLLCVCVCVCACVFVENVDSDSFLNDVIHFLSVCVCVCVRERERERGSCIQFNSNIQERETCRLKFTITPVCNVMWLRT